MTAEAIAAGIIFTVQAYLIIGLVFAVPFVLLLVNRVDPSAKGSTWGFRILVTPGVCLLWPLMLLRLLRGGTTPVECNAHRNCATSRVVEPPEKAA
jgi:uncharacterized membrane-anchored protein